MHQMPRAAIAVMLLLFQFVQFMDNLNAQESRDSGAIVREIAEIANQRLSDIQTAKVKFLQFRFGKIVHENLQIEKTADEVGALISSTGLANGDEHKFRQFLEAYSGKSLDDPAAVGRDGKVPTLRGEFLMSGQKTRNQQDGVVETYDGADFVFSRKLSGQTTIGHPSAVKIQRTELDSFRRLVAPDKLSDFVFESEEAPLVHLRSTDGLTELILDRNTGLLRRLRIFTSENRLKTEFHQVGDLDHKTIPFPRSAVQLQYSRNEKAEQICMSVVLDAEFNTAIPDESFNHEVEAGVKVVDLRENPEHPSIGFSAKFSPNVLAGYEKRHPESFDPSVQARPQQWIWVLIVNVMILCAVSVAISRRRHPAK